VTQTVQPQVEKATQKVKEVDEKQGLSLKARASYIIGAFSISTHRFMHELNLV